MYSFLLSIFFSNDLVRKIKSSLIESLFFHKQTIHYSSCYASEDNLNEFFNLNHLGLQLINKNRSVVNNIQRIHIFK